MRKTILISISILFWSQVSFSYALNDCSGLEADYNATKDQVTQKMDTWKSLRESDPKKSAQGKILSDLLAQ